MTARLNACFVFLGRVLVERRRVRPAQVGEGLGARLDEVDVVAVALLRLVALGPVVGALGLVALPDQVGLVALEQVELTRDDVRESASAKHR